MATISVTTMRDAQQALTQPDMRQALYDESAVIMEGVLLNLHGEEHRRRRTLEFRLFRRDVFHHYEREIFPRTLKETLAPFVAQGYADLVEFGYRVTINLTADFTGIDRPLRTPEETERLLAMVKTFSEGAIMVHSARDKDVVRAEVRAALANFDEDFLAPSIARRLDLIGKVKRGEIGADALTRDVLTVLLQNEDQLDLPPDLLRREAAFYMQAGSHSTNNSTTHAIHDIFGWLALHPEERTRLMSDPLYLQRCVHESMRLHPASPEAGRRPVCPVTLQNGRTITSDDLVMVDLPAANRDKSIFGEDADVFNPNRHLPVGQLPFGLTFGTGVHSCIGRDLDGGLVSRPDTDPATHQYGIVPMLVRVLLEHGAQPDPNSAPTMAEHTIRKNWGSYPIIFKR